MLIHRQLKKISMEKLIPKRGLSCWKSQIFMLSTLYQGLHKASRVSSSSTEDTMAASIGKDGILLWGIVCHENEIIIAGSTTKKHPSPVAEFCAFCTLNLGRTGALNLETFECFNAQSFDAEFCEPQRRDKTMF